MEDIMKIAEDKRKLDVIQFYQFSLKEKKK